MTTPIKTQLTFESLALPDFLIKAIQDVGYEIPSPIQAKCIPHILEGKDLLGLAQTGTGKTAAFALPVLANLDTKMQVSQVLILTPTRELAIQVAEAFQRYARYMSHFHVLPVYGGQDMRGQIRGLKRGMQVIVGTPGRTMDHIRRGNLKLNQINTVILDEADEMLKMGFIDDIEWIMERTPESKQVALFSATMPSQIRKIADKYLKKPVCIEIKAKTATVNTITQKVWMVGGVHKLDALTRILEVEPFDGVLVFVRTKTATAELAEKLSARGLAAAALNGDMSQMLREKAIDRLKRGSLDILVATDVAARGLDVERISHVINYDIPYDAEAYVHRIGRTGRAGRKGIAILFAAQREIRMLRAIEKATRQRIEAMALPSMKDVREQRIQQFKTALNETLQEENKAELLPFSEIITDFKKECDCSLEEIAAALCYIAQKERPFPDEKEEAPVSYRQPKERKKNNSKKSNADRERKPRRSEYASDVESMTRYRVALGKSQGVTPRDLVGAIANEGGVSGNKIGHIRLFENHSSIYLPKELNKATVQHLAEIKIRNQAMGIVLWQQEQGQSKSVSSRPPSRNNLNFNKKPRSKNVDRRQK